MHSLSRFPGLVLDGLQGNVLRVLSRHCRWAICPAVWKAQLASVKDAVECLTCKQGCVRVFFFFSSQCFCGLIGSLVSELWCSSWPVWLTALMKRIRSDWALMLWSLLLNLSSVNPSFYLASNWIPVWGQFGLTEATLSQLFCQEKMMMTCSISSLGLLLVVIANTIIPEPEELYW